MACVLADAAPCLPCADHRRRLPLAPPCTRSTPFEGMFGGGPRGGGASGKKRSYASDEVIDVSIDHTDD